MFAQLLDLYVSGLSIIIHVLLVRIENIREYVQEGLQVNLKVSEKPQSLAGRR